MWVRAIFGVALLSAGASCVPAPDVATQAVPPVKPIRDPRLLLTKLGLAVPEGPLAEAPSSPAAPITERQIAAAPPFVETTYAPDAAARARECLTAAVYYEARSEAPDGQRAVAQVVLNRVRNRAFPNTVCGVVYQGSNRRTGCQFSFTCDGSLYRPREPGAWDRARSIADAALSGSVFAGVGSATSYHTTAILPWWAPSLARVTTIGAHVFYRWRSNLERALSYGQRYAGVEPVIGASPASVGREAVAAAFGVQVHYGSTDAQPAAAGKAADVAFGVAIHRGTERAAVTTEPASTAVASDDAHGVRVHFGTRAATAEIADATS
jgi:Cell Wall Hydrolase